jgi:hypothetical protein
MTTRTTAVVFSLLAASLGLPDRSEGAPVDNSPIMNSPIMNSPIMNSPIMNSPIMNSPIMNSSLLDSGSMDGYQLNGMTTNQGQHVYYTSLQGSKLTGWAWVYEYGNFMTCNEYGSCWYSWRYDWNWRGVGPAELVGGWIDSSVTDGPTVGGVTSVYIAGAWQASGADADVWLYYLYYQSQYYGWQPVCNGDGWSVAVNGRWNTSVGQYGGGDKTSSAANTLTFGCRSGAIGKCASGRSLPNSLGYKPWVGPTWQYGSWSNWLNSGLADAHQACTRMIRADYCGDGNDHTDTGTRIDTWDHLQTSGYYTSTGQWITDSTYQINHESTDGNMLPLSQFEAVWGRDGAVKVWTERIQSRYKLPLDGNGERVCPTYHVPGQTYDFHHQWTYLNVLPPRDGNSAQWNGETGDDDIRRDLPWGLMNRTSRY